MKKFFVFILIITFAASLFAGCTTADPTAPPTTAAPTDTPMPSPTDTPHVDDSAPVLINPIEINENDEYTVFVDTVNGNDDNNGSFTSPFKSIGKAQTKARTLLKNADRDVIVCLRAGTYELSKPLTFTGADSGNGEHYMVYTSYKNEKVVLSGGVSVTGWTKHDEAKNIWVADADGIVSRDFFVNGVRADRARTEAMPEIEEFTDVYVKLIGLDKLARPQDVEFVFENLWNQPRVGVESGASVGKITIFNMRQPAWNTFCETSGLLGQLKLDKDQFSYLENAYEFIDVPGEWYLNTEEGKVYYMPRANEDLATAYTVFGVAEKLMLLQGTKDAPVSNLAFYGLQFSYTTWMQASSDAGLLTFQANFYKKEGTNSTNIHSNDSWMLPSSAIWGEVTQGVKFQYNTFSYLGNGGLHLAAGTKNAVISRNNFIDCASTGIMLGGFTDDDHSAINKKGSNFDKKGYLLTQDCSITDNFINKCSSVYAGGCGITVGYVSRVDVSYNTLLNLPYSGISFGWGWGFQQDELRGNRYYVDENGKNLFCDSTITHNRIENIMNVLFDGGGIYTLGRNDNLLISDNYINLVNDEYGGVYMDDGSQGITFTNNVISNAFRNFCYKGDYNYIYDNYTSPGTAQKENNDLRFPLVEGEYHYRFENNDLWDEAKVAAIKNAAGVRAE